MEPKIRFKGFEGEWKKVIIKDICKKESSVLSENALGENTGNYAVYGASGYIQNIATYDISTDYVGIIKDGSGVGRTKLYPAYSSLLGTMQYIIAKENCCIYFLEPLLQTIDFTTFISGSGIPHIYFRDYEDMEVSIPSLAEQQAIASYFTSLDSQISASTSRLASLKQMKAASLQAMFPQEGETVPKIRFKGFEGEWKKVIIKDICKKKSSVLSENALGENTGNYAVYGASGYIQNIATYDISTDYVGIIKDGSGVGRTKLYPAYSSLLGTMQYIIAKENCCIYFLEPLLQTIDFTTFISGSGIPHIYFRDYEDMEVSIPSLAEQQAIASYFTSLDRQISLQSQRLEKLKQIKSACLDKMFV